MNDFVLYFLLLSAVVFVLGVLYLAISGLWNWFERKREPPQIRWWRQRVAELHVEYFGHEQFEREPGRHRLKPTRGRYHCRIPCRELLAEFGW